MRMRQSIPKEHMIFDDLTIRARRNHCASQFEHYNFLARWCNDRLCERLEDIKRTFETVLILGGRDSDYLREKLEAVGARFVVISDIAENFLPRDKKTERVQAREDILPFASNSFDLVISSTGLHSVNDLPGALLQINRVLKPDGAFLGAFAGGETLIELRHAMTQAEMNIYGGMSPRIFPMADKQDAGALLQRAGFSLPVVDSEHMTVTYKTAYHLLKDLKGMGESNALSARRKITPSKKLFPLMDKIYAAEFKEPDGRLPATFEFIFMIGWAPHESQQKPLARGSAKQRLSDALETKEHKL